MDDEGEATVMGENEGDTFFDNRELPPNQANPTPSNVYDTLTQVSEFLGAYGWYILLAAVGLYYLKTRYDSRIQEWRDKRGQQDDLSRYDEDTILSRQEAIDRARRKMQEEHDRRADEHRVIQKQKEEEKRKQEIEDWQNHREGKGYKSKAKNRVLQEPVATPGAEGGTGRSKKKIKDDYNPLMAAGSGSAFRPTWRSGASGGG